MIDSTDLKSLELNFVPCYFLIPVKWVENTGQYVIIASVCYLVTQKIHCSNITLFGIFQSLPAHCMDWMNNKECPLRVALIESESNRRSFKNFPYYRLVR